MGILAFNPNWQTSYTTYRAGTALTVLSLHLLAPVAPKALS